MGVAAYVGAIVDLRLRVIRTSGSAASDPAAGGIKHFLGPTTACDQSKATEGR